MHNLNDTNVRNIKIYILKKKNNNHDCNNTISDITLH